MAEVTVTTFAELEVAIHDNQDTPIHLNAATFTLTEDLMLDYNCVIDVINRNTIVTGNNSFRFIIKDCSSVLGNSAGDYTLTFQNGDTNTVEIQAATADTDITFYYCKFKNAQTAKGLVALTGAGFDCLTKCYNCEATGNNDDGFAVNDDLGVAVDWNIMWLVDCTSHANTGSGSAQGAAAHNAKEILMVSGGSYYSNQSSGLTPAGASVLLVTGMAEIYSNGAKQIVTDAADSTLIIDGAKIYGIAAASQGIFINTASTVIVRNTEIYGGGVAQNLLLFGSASKAAFLQNCIFRGCTNSNKYAVQLNAWAVIDHCDFYDNERHLFIQYPLPITNSVFQKCGTGDFGIKVEGGFNDHYSDCLLSGNNCFYDNRPGLHLNNFYPTATPVKSNDIEADPQFVDAPNADFRLKLGSPCLNMAQAYMNSVMSIGQWQKKQGVFRPIHRM